MDINDRIRAIRKDQKLTQTEFASRLFMSMFSISQIERKVNVPAQRTIDMICQEFNVNKEWLETGEGEMYNLPTDEEEEIFQRLALKTDVSAQVLKMVIKWYVTLNDEGIARLGEMIEEELKKTSLM